jgi:hypothetical protein
VKTPGPIVLTWGLVPPDVQKVTVSRSPSWPNGFTVALPPPNDTSYTDVLAVTGVPYSYSVCVVYGSAQAVWQPNTACASVSGEVPSPPAPFHPPKLGPTHIIVVPSQGQSSPNRIGGERPGGAILQASDACRPGLVWRMANPTDHVCVTPQARAQIAADTGASRKQEPRGAIGGTSAPACPKGYVWRLTNAADKACVRATSDKR